MIKNIFVNIVQAKIKIEIKLNYMLIILLKLLKVDKEEFIKKENI